MLPFNHNDNCTGSVCFCDDYNKQIEHLHNNSITEEIKSLKAENARYREALEFIVLASDGFVWKIADKALKGGE